MIWRVWRLVAVLVGVLLVSACLPLLNDDKGTDLQGIEYVKDADEQQILNVYPPQGKTDGPRPAVVWVHGGGWSSGTAEVNPLGWNKLDSAPTLISVGYRFAPEHPSPAQYEDVSAALDYVFAHATELNIDTDRVILAGLSAGGHLATLVGLRTDRPISAIMNFAGPSDFRDFEARTPTTQTGKFWQRTVSDLLGCESGPKCGEAAADASPTTYVHKGQPPMFVQQGEADPIVPRATIDSLVTASQQVGAQVQYERVPELGHAMTFSSAAAAFVARYLG